MQKDETFRFRLFKRLSSDNPIPSRKNTRFPSFRPAACHRFQHLLLLKDTYPKKDITWTMNFDDKPTSVTTTGLFPTNRAHPRLPDYGNITFVPYKCS